MRSPLRNALFGRSYASSILHSDCVQQVDNVFDVAYGQTEASLIASLADCASQYPRVVEIESAAVETLLDMPIQS